MSPRAQRRSASFRLFFFSPLPPPAHEELEKKSPYVHARAFSRVRLSVAAPRAEGSREGRREGGRKARARGLPTLLKPGRSSPSSLSLPHTRGKSVLPTRGPGENGDKRPAAGFLVLEAAVELKAHIPVRPCGGAGRGGRGLSGGGGAQAAQRPSSRRERAAAEAGSRAATESEPDGTHHGRDEGEERREASRGEGFPPPLGPSGAGRPSLSGLP